MKKILITLMTVFVLVSTTPSLSKAAASIKLIYSQNLDNQLNDESYKNLVSTVIYPYVEKAIEDYYKDYMKYPPGEAPVFYKFLSFETAPYGNYSFNAVLEVQPFVGPHLSVGRDRITLRIDLKGVAVEKYEHLGNYQLPPHYQDIMKKPLPGPLL